MNLSKVVALLKETIWKIIITTMFEVYKPRMFSGFILRPKDVCPSMDIISIILADGIKDLHFYFILFAFSPKDADLRTLRIRTVEWVIFDASLASL
jgi:hypothetical protein